MSSTEEIPNEFLCPITLEIMREPMVMPDGQTYEREAIKQALEITHVSPLTKAPMDFSDGVINYSLKSLIENYAKSKNITLDSNTVKLENLKLEESIEPVEFEDLGARVITTDESAGLCKDSLHVYMKPKKEKAAPPLCLICVVDVSGSMGSNCCENVENMESMYISRIGLIKHSLKTIIATLRKEDMISVVTFETSANVLLKPMVLANENIKKRVIEKVDTMEACGGTNIWAGIKKGIDISGEIPFKNYQKSIMVFTDGESYHNPPKGVYNTLKDTLKVCHDNFTISTFSFGNDVGPELLIDIANLGNGIYGYCSDGTMVGTIFINYMANQLSTISPIVNVTVTQGDDIKKTMTIGPLYRASYRNAIFKINKKLLDNTKVTVKLPMTNQEFDVPVNSESADLQKYIDEMAEKEEEEKKEIEKKEEEKDDDDEDDELLDDDDEDGKEDLIVNIEDIDTSANIEESDEKPARYEERLLNQILRNKFILTVNKILELDIAGNEDDYDKADGLLTQYVDSLKQLKFKTEFIKNLIIDVSDPDPNHGQVEKAIKQDYYGTWGKSYLTSFLKYHQFEQCGNFKDQSLQYYSHEVFEAYRKMANTLFVNIPPPEDESGRGVSHGASMSNFINPSGGCFNGEALVVLADGSCKCVKDLKKGDRLRNGATVQCLIEQDCDKTSRPIMCDINGVLLTPYHPVAIKDCWYFPIDITPAKAVSVASWFNLVLEDEEQKKYEVEFENGVKAITLGHHRTENDVLKHPYFGTDAVLKDLYERDPNGYDEGYIHIKEFNPRHLQYDENHCCINYYKLSSPETNTSQKSLYEFRQVYSIF